jgi:hypothetical protein
VYIKSEIQLKGIANCCMALWKVDYYSYYYW